MTTKKQFQDATATLISFLVLGPIFISLVVVFSSIIPGAVLNLFFGISHLWGIPVGFILVGIFLIRRRGHNERRRAPNLVD